MKNNDLFLIILAIVLAGLFLSRFLSGFWLIKAAVGLLTLTILLYWKLYPYKNQLSPIYLKWFIQIEKTVTPLWSLFKNVPKIQLGQNLAMESAPFIICSILIIILTII